MNKKETALSEEQLSVDVKSWTADPALREKVLVKRKQEMLERARQYSLDILLLN